MTRETVIEFAVPFCPDVLQVTDIFQWDMLSFKLPHTLSGDQNHKYVVKVERLVPTKTSTLHNLRGL